MKMEAEWNLERFCITVPIVNHNNKQVHDVEGHQHLNFQKSAMEARTNSTKYVDFKTNPLSKTQQPVFYGKSNVSKALLVQAQSLDQQNTTID